VRLFEWYIHKVRYIRYNISEMAPTIKSEERNVAVIAPFPCPRHLGASSLASSPLVPRPAPYYIFALGLSILTVSGVQGLAGFALSVDDVPPRMKVLGITIL